MGGKGRKRREKNYRAAHGAPNRLPPPPAPSSIDALPSKLRKLISFSSSRSSDSSVKLSVDSAQKNIGAGGSRGVEKKFGSEDKLDFKTTGVKTKATDGVQQHMDVDTIDKSSTLEKKKKKKKRKPVDDLRFDGELLGLGSKRKERKKKRLEEMKKKRKKGKGEGEDDNMDFPKHEDIKFGDVVKAPLKLVTVPKAPKAAHDASKERIRIQAVEAYRERRGWTSRPGLNLPPPDITSPSV